MAVYAPIYKDTIWTYDTPFIQYRIESPQGNVILEGRADTRPDGTPPTIYVNRLCEPFLAQELNPVESGLTLQPAYREFYLYNDLNDALLETYGFLRMYSGDWEGENLILNDPIRPSISKDMNVPCTACFKSGGFAPVGKNSIAYYMSFADEPLPIVPKVYEIRVPVSFNEKVTTIPADHFYGRVTLLPGATNVNFIPKTVLTNEDGLIRTIRTKELPGGGPYIDHNYDTGYHYLWTKYSGSGPSIIYNGGKYYIYFFVTQGSGERERTATFSFYTKRPYTDEEDWICSVKIIQPALTN